MGLSDTKKRARGPLLFLGGSKIINLEAAVRLLYRQCPCCLQGANRGVCITIAIFNTDALAVFYNLATTPTTVSIRFWLGG
ncbi:MAG TPA: hypothetical protein DCQ10_01135, partial [Rhodobacteraceae bacterium]|nr:hypothetical protein [Paracoccaceae bacterium]